MTTIPPFVPPYRAPSNVLYVTSGYFDGNWANADSQQQQQILTTIQSTVTALGATSFNVFINFSLGASIDSSNNVTFTFNGTTIADLYPNLSSEFLTLSGTNDSMILISLGGWAAEGDFAALQQYQNNVGSAGQLIFDQVIQPLGLNGLDIDLEASGTISWQQSYQDYGGLIATITNDLAALGCIVTHVPPSGVANEYYINGDPSNGIPSIVQACQTSTGNNISWLNIQFYGGGEVGDEKATEDYYNAYLLSPLTQLDLTGVNPNTFLVAGFDANPSADQDLTFITDVLSNLTQTNGSVGGCFVWNYGQIPANAVNQWAFEINAAMEPASSSSDARTPRTAKAHG